MDGKVSLSFEPSVGSQAREMRVSLDLTQQELACAAGVSENDIKLLEQDIPAALNCKTSVFKILWEKTTIKNLTSS